MPRTKGVTIRDVAQRAGVSIAAVSMALNDTGTLSAETRLRIRGVAEEMEYEADALARGLRRSSVGAIGIVMRSLDSLGQYAPRGVDVFTRYIGAASSLAADRGLSVMLVPDPTRRPTPPLALSLDGYIVAMPHLDDPVVRLFERRGIPYVTLGRDPSRPGFTDWATEDEAMTLRRILEHFHAAGARSIVLVHGTDPNAWNLDSESTYRAWCADHDVEPRVHAAPEGSGEEGGTAVAGEIVDGGIPDAVLCLTGRHAAGVLAGLHAHGIAVPERTMIATASDSEHTRHSRPAISAVELNPEATMRALLDLLQARIAGEPSAGPIVTPARFRVRASSRR
ncbi:LacI family DNA-binding transcriptional regulator [Microbacterium sp. ASV49]|uniref:LacI family DNA-binding transcriptional regulator n=1 Tax=Microbacterium candidum TaxID=3041922 RepID=A0ABT7MVS6_9MICO|nr:LacI family DNA-binding transcriptional regulator [Microbacterium sp. ASV49]MDL9978560.1 LacI family DNA-binding transcriptional regulator [Microbacterium sp. ASV49]